MSKTAHILAVEASRLPAHINDNDGFFLLHDGIAVEALTHAGLFLGPRPLLEEDERFRQIIPYVVLRRDGRFATYTRGASGNEARLHGKLAIGVGGHIDIPDVRYDKNGVVELGYTLTLAADREIAEEVRIKGEFNPARFLGLLVCNKTPVDRVHIGVVGVIDLDPRQKVEAGEDSQEDLTWLTPDELRAESERLENWTALLLPSLQQLATA